MTLHSYVIEHDFGFAPNPFHGVCSLATCKPVIRKCARLGDFIVGTGCAGRKRRGYLVYFMRVDEETHFNQYWDDPRFLAKRPNLNGSTMQAYGDNIYHRDTQTRRWKQANSLHSLPTGKLNTINLNHDIGTTERVLLGRDFCYWGGYGPVIPKRFRNFQDFDICAIRGHKNRFPKALVDEFVAWLRSLGKSGLVGAPLEWSYSRR